MGGGLRAGVPVEISMGMGLEILQKVLNVVLNVYLHAQLHSINMLEVC